MLGLELLDGGALAIAVNGRGEVQERALVEDTDDLAVAADAALARVRTSSRGSAALGITAFHHDSPAVMAAIASLSGRFAGPFVHAGATPSGVAAISTRASVSARCLANCWPFSLRNGWPNADRGSRIADRLRLRLSKPVRTMGGWRKIC